MRLINNNFIFILLLFIFFPIYQYREEEMPKIIIKKSQTEKIHKIIKRVDNIKIPERVLKEDLVIREKSFKIPQIYHEPNNKKYKISVGIAEGWFKYEGYSSPSGIQVKIEF